MLLRTNPHIEDMVCRRYKTHFSSRPFLPLTKKQSKVKVLLAMVLRSNCSQFLLFSESLTSSAISDGVAKFLE